MTAISLKLPDDLARESKSIAESIGISRTELIRRALRHELDEVKSQLEREAMAHAFEVMRDDPAYNRESEELDVGLDEILPGEADGWWKG
jgi:metal-responsive CopG/Arc/MetJ family transcriptional regulator